MKILGIGLSIALCAAGLVSFTSATSIATLDGNNDGDTTVKKLVPAGNYITTIGGCNNFGGGTLSKEAFMALLNNPLCGKDNKTNKNFAVASFELTYCWRELSEDSTGHSIIVSDNISESIDGDAVPEKWKKNFANNIYKGDTIKFENIKIRNGSLKYKSKNSVLVVIGG
jgi:hypothetical protein